jgi:hypothetical protein
MDRPDRLRPGPVWQTIRTDLSRLPSRFGAPTLDPSLLRQVRALLGLLAGLLLVALAHHRSSEAGARHFHEEHLLPGEAWRAVLASRGFRPLALNRASPGDGKVRISRDGRIIEFPGGIPDLPTGVHIRGVPAPKPDWIELSPGIAGFETWIRSLDAHPVSDVKSSKPRVNSIDPKEFSY